MRIYEAIIEDTVNGDVFKSHGIASSEEEFRSIYGGNGEFVRIRDVTSKFEVNVDVLHESLISLGYDNILANAIVETVSAHYAGAVANDIL